MKRIAITGGSGSMGFAAFKELLNRRDQYNITLLMRPSKKNIKKFSPYFEKGTKIESGITTEKDAIRITWGSITNLEVVKNFIKDSDVVINMAAIIPPVAYKKKEDTDATNIGGVENIITAIKSIPNGAETIRFITVSSVAVYGDRLPPYHMIEIGDPVYPSVGDTYGLTKVRAERAIIESGLRYWAVVRQTFITIENLFSLMDPIMFHQPIDQHIEFVTFRDAGYGIVNCIDAPEKFWRNIYNMSGGKEFQVVYHEFLNKMFGIFGLDSYKCLKRNWFTLRNFHCGWYTDADSNRLNQYAKYQRDTYEDFLEFVEKTTPKFLKISKIVPSVFVRFFMKFYADPIKWGTKTEKYPTHLKAYFGSEEAFKAIPDWDSNMPKKQKPIKIELGFTRREDGKYTISDMKSLAEFRGGKCLSKKFKDLYTPLKWKCDVCNNEFEATPILLTDGGFWCPDCEAPIWNYDEIAKKNKFIAQLHYNTHSKDEHQIVTTAEIIRERKL